MISNSTKESGTPQELFINSICERLKKNKRVRRTLPINGRIHIDRKLPFLCVYRIPPSRLDNGTRQLVKSEASYIIAPGSRIYHGFVSNLIYNVVKTLSTDFGSFLIVEIWSEDNHRRIDTGDENHLYKPYFKIITYESRIGTLSTTVESLRAGLQNIRILKQHAEIETLFGRKDSPPLMPPLLESDEMSKTGCRKLGIAVKPIYKNKKNGEIYPLVLQAIRHGISHALKKTFFEFTQNLTTHRPQHYLSMGRRAFVKAAYQVDSQIAKISNAYDFLLQVTPINSEQAWRGFKRSKFQKEPIFYYRPRTIDPDILKRSLYNIKIERVEDPALSQIFKEKRLEIDRQITMILDRGSKRFLYGSMQLYGGVDNDILKFANIILQRIPPRSREISGGKRLGAAAFAEKAQIEIEYYKNQMPNITSTVELREDIASGLMVSRGNLLIGKYTKIPRSRVEALLQHEVGTHILTYLNGKAQPINLLHNGLAGYEQLQEGLAVLSEYLVGGLSRPRLRLLAGRVIAVKCIIDGASFIETFNTLNRNYDFEQNTAFTISLRVFRGGGLTKDALYLRGFKDILNYIKLGGNIEELLVGKISSKHIKVIEELQYRKVLNPIPLKPRYLFDVNALQRLEGLRGGLSIIDIIERRKKI